MARTVEAQEHPAQGAQLLPHTPLGKWGLGLMVLAALSPVYWAVLTPLVKHSDPDASIRTAVVFMIAVTAIAVGVAALTRREARSILLMVASAIVAIEIAFTAWFVTSF